jgi:hypothetical protein
MQISRMQTPMEQETFVSRSQEKILPPGQDWTDRRCSQLMTFLSCLMMVCVVNADSNDAGDNEVDLKNPGFELWKTFNSQSYLSNWSAQQHAGEPSFVFLRDEEEFVSGESSLRIERIGTQPWGSVVQVIPTPKLKGKRFRFSAEAKMDKITTDGFSLMVIVKGVGVGGSPIYTRKFDGLSSWENASIEGVIPKSATRITVGMTLEYGQVLWLDNAQLEVLP